MAVRSTGWHPSAAYLYTVHLDGPSLAWEYLRRNPGYRLDWQQCRGDTMQARCWCLRQFEDPARDARCTQPAWLPEVDASTPR